MHLITIPSPAGVFQARFSSKGLVSLHFPGSAPDSFEPPAPPPPDRWVDLTRSAVLTALRGSQPSELAPLDLSAATPFQREVWAALQGIASGETRTYAEVARAIGRPQASRAVGAACGANPIPLLIPCHRVVASNGALGGFSGGLNWKERLLKTEFSVAGSRLLSPARATGSNLISNQALAAR